MTGSVKNVSAEETDRKQRQVVTRLFRPVRNCIMFATEEYMKLQIKIFVQWTIRFGLGVMLQSEFGRDKQSH